MIKRIGTAAREELERFFSTRVFLDLHVRVAADWREDERVLHDIGVGRPRGEERTAEPSCSHSCPRLAACHFTPPTR